jgi:putative restriction endonuclease
LNFILNDIQTYLHYFYKLRRDSKNGGAPHKPILLLAVSRLVEKGCIDSRFIDITPELVIEFKDLWYKLVVTDHNPNFSLPFFHMRSEPFWKLVSKAGTDFPLTSSHSIKSLIGLKDALLYAEIDEQLFRLFMDPMSNTVIQEVLLEKYFPDTKKAYHTSGADLFSELETQILHEDQVVYRQRIDELKNNLSKEEFEEELFVRGGVFKREIPKIYNYQCAISGMRVESTSNAQMVDACHIVPFAFSKDDTITNGISLSPNFHRAFDRGLITISSDFKVKISSTVREIDSPYSLGQFNGMKVRLPENMQFHPSVANLQWHEERIFR